METQTHTHTHVYIQNYMLVCLCALVCVGVLEHSSIHFLPCNPTAQIALCLFDS